MAKIIVTAGAGRMLPIPSSLGMAPGGGQLRLQPGDELELEESLTFVVRALRNGDAVRVTRTTKGA